MDLERKETSSVLLHTLANELYNRTDWSFLGRRVEAALVEDHDKLHVVLDDGSTLTYALSHETESSG
jgi:hypothetical protein